MYRAAELTESDGDIHRFVWRRTPDAPLQDYRMTRVTSGVPASTFAANMSVKQNALNFARDYPLAVKAVDESFYVDDGLASADSVEEAIELQRQLQNLFASCSENGTPVNGQFYNISHLNSGTLNPSTQLPNLKSTPRHLELLGTQPRITST